LGLLSGIRASSREKGQPPRRKERPESRLLFRMLQDTREHTGHAHLRELAVLLQRPLGEERIEAEIIERRLRALWSFYSKKRRRHVFGRLLLRGAVGLGHPI